MKNRFRIHLIIAGVFLAVGLSGCYTQVTLRDRYPDREEYPEYSETYVDTNGTVVNNNYYGSQRTMFFDYYYPSRFSFHYSVWDPYWDNPFVWDPWYSSCWPCYRPYYGGYYSGYYGGGYYGGWYDPYPYYGGGSSYNRTVYRTDSRSRATSARSYTNVSRSGRTLTSPPPSSAVGSRSAVSSRSAVANSPVRTRTVDQGLYNNGRTRTPGNSTGYPTYNNRGRDGSQPTTTNPGTGYYGGSNRNRTQGGSTYTPGTSSSSTRSGRTNSSGSNSSGTSTSTRDRETGKYTPNSGSSSGSTSRSSSPTYTPPPTRSSGSSSGSYDSGSRSRSSSGSSSSGSSSSGSSGRSSSSGSSSSGGPSRSRGR